MSSVTSSQDYGSSSRPERYLSSEFPVMPFEYVRKQIQRRPKVSRLESDHGMGIVHPVAEMHS